MIMKKWNNNNKWIMIINENNEINENENEIIMKINENENEINENNEK